MNELPRDARALLALTRDAHDPPDEMAKERVRVRLAALASVPVASSLLRPGRVAKPGATGWLASSKPMLTGALMALAVGSGIWALAGQGGRPSSASSAVGVQTQTPEALPPAVPTANAPQVTPLPPPPERAPAATDLDEAPSARRTSTTRNAQPARVRAARSGAAEGSSLSQETALLARAADSLSHNDITSALATIDEHRRRFGRSQLSQERRGLLVLAHCLQSPTEARPEARAYIGRAPASVLIARLELACGL